MDFDYLTLYKYLHAIYGVIAVVVALISYLALRGEYKPYDAELWTLAVGAGASWGLWIPMIIFKKVL